MGVSDSMCGRVVTKALVAGVLLAGLGAGTATAMNLVAGGYGVDVERYTPPASLSMRSMDFSSSAGAGSAGLTFDFTPRNSGSLFNQRHGEAERPLSLSFGVQEGFGDELRLDTIGLGAETEANSGARASLEGLAVGGALQLRDWQVNGSLGRTNLLGREADVFAAGLGYGRLNARLVYGSVPETTTDGPGDVLMLSTDLAAWSWLTLQGDIAVSDTLTDEPLTVGRIGLRLKF